MNTAVTLALVLTFAALVTVHVATVWGIGRRRRALDAAVALVAAPVAPYWAMKSGMPVRGAAWIALAVAYAIALLLAR